MAEPTCSIREFLSIAEGRLKVIQALCENPYWMSERRWRIQHEADYLLQLAKEQDNDRTNIRQDS